MQQYFLPQSYIDLIANTAALGGGGVDAAWEQSDWPLGDLAQPVQNATTNNDNPHVGRCVALQ